MKNYSLLSLSAAATALLLSACAPPKTPPPPAPKVTVTLPVTATVTNWDEYPGHLEAVETVEVRPRVSGYIDSIHFQDGAEVKAGDLLFVIDPRPYQAEFDRAQAQRQQAETRLELAQNDLKRAEGLKGTKAISEEEYDSRSKAVREAEAALAAAKAAEATGRINLDYTQVKAPISGKIGRRLITAGNFVQLQGSGGAAAVLATIVSRAPIYCYFDATEQAFLSYCRDGRGLDSLPCEMALVGDAGFPHRGQVDFYNNQVDPQTGTIRLRAVFENRDLALVPGLSANVRVPAGPPVQSLLVPDVAVGSDQGRKFVLVVNKDNAVETRMVKTDRQHGALRSILEGLTPQDQVIVNGLMLVRSGMKVQVQTEQADAQTPKPGAPKPSQETQEPKSKAGESKANS